MVDSKENHSRDFGGERVKLEIIPQILQTYWQSFPFVLAKRASCEDRRSKQIKIKKSTTILVVLPQPHPFFSFCPRDSHLAWPLQTETTLTPAITPPE